MKDEVLELLRDKSLKLHEKFNQAIQLFRKSKYANPIAMRSYNQIGASPEAVRNLCYDLQKMHGITDAEIRSKQLKEEKENETPVVLSEDLLGQIREIDLETADYNKELNPLANELSDVLGIALKNQKKATLVSFIGTFKEKHAEKNTDEVIENIFDDEAKEAKQGLKLRQQYPFLGTEDCPDKLKILVSDKITAFQNVIEARKELFKAKNGEPLPEEEILHICKSAVDNLELNSLIFKELNYYKEHEEILGEHPIFADEVMAREVQEMSDNNAHKVYRNLATYISKENKKLEDAKTAETKAKIQAVIDDHQTRRALIAKKLRLEDEK